ncbi:hypothetical protein MKJ04_14210 [Pontibacter sp. E15-1]|nr:hypothetical protein [Pontibacter sp. E15-1]MCJ8165997.1 hypothetical protein [Pontibacter sp. E15-1]
MNVDKASLVKFAQKAEHTFAGVQCGIMDQSTFTRAHGPTLPQYALS